MNYEEKYNAALERARKIHSETEFDYEKGMMEEIFPELIEDDDERVRKGLIKAVSRTFEGNKLFDTDVTREEALAWLDKQDANKEYVFRPVAGTMIERAVEQALEQGDVVLAFNGFYTPVKGKTSDEILAEYDHWIEKQGEPNPYSGVSFKYNDHIWGMCARDNGVDILLDKQLFKHLEKQCEKNINHTDIKEKAHQIAWETSKDYDPSLSKEAWCEMAALDMASWLKREIDAAYLQGVCDTKHEIEKQGEQETTDKTKTKFKNGDYIVPDNITSLEIWKVINIDEDGYYNIQPITNIINTEDNEIYRVPGFILEKDYHLWTIKDAKDGDVLAHGQVVFIFKVICDARLYCHCLYHNDGTLIAESYDVMTYKYFSEVHPATKEQRDLLFRKIKEAGYEWNAEKKELKKIEYNYNVNDFLDFYS